MLNWVTPDSVTGWQVLGVKLSHQGASAGELAQQNPSRVTKKGQVRPQVPG